MIGSYFAAEYVRVKRPRRRAAAARRSATAEATTAEAATSVSARRREHLRPCAPRVAVAWLAGHAQHR